MKLLYLVADASTGGHTRTATTVASALRQRGHEVLFAVSHGQNATVPRDAGFEVVPISRRSLGGYDALLERRVLPRLVRERGVQALHSFSPHTLVEACRAGRRLGVPVLWTICGGAPPRPGSYPALGSIISLSHEVRDALVRDAGFPAGAVRVVPARIDAGAVRRTLGGFSPERALALRRRYGIPADARVVLRVARLSAPYRESIVQGALAVERLARRGRAVVLLHVGDAREQEAADAVDAHFAAVNARAGRTLAVSARDQAAEAVALLRMADVAIATGRSAFEAMVAEVPTVVVGPRGFGGTVTPETVDEIAHFNFSGRHLPAALPREESVERLAACIAALLDSPAERERLGAFGRRWVERELDVSIAAARYEAAYREWTPQCLPPPWQLRRLAARRAARGIARALLPLWLRRRVLRLRGR